MTGRIAIPDDHPLLKALCWDVPGNIDLLDEKSILNRYERGWRYNGPLSSPSYDELAYIRMLAERHQSWLSAEISLEKSLPHELIKIAQGLNPELLGEMNLCLAGELVYSSFRPDFPIKNEIKLICSSLFGYAKALKLLTESHSITPPLFSNASYITLPRVATTDQYGMRFPIANGDKVIKVEISRMCITPLIEPEYMDWAPGIPCLSRIDRFAEKLLLNADRWTDKSVESRDLIDLGMLRNLEGNCEEAYDKGESAYPVKAPLLKAIDYFLAHEDYQKSCFATLQINEKAINQALSGILQLKLDLAPQP